MLRNIVITDRIAGETWLYEKTGRAGQKKLVPTYHANIEQTNGSLFWFAVTRDSARIVFGYETERFLPNGECPPSKTGCPYFAKHQEAPRNGDCLLLYENRNDLSLLGQGKISRHSVLIHRTPASSLGCFGVAGGDEGYQVFWEVLTTTTNNFAAERPVRVHVEPRPDWHHQIHLA